MALSVQLAIQGGGAKIASLLAALEAVDDLQQQGVLKVTRISGTSAGAIAGALYAAGLGVIKNARIRLASISPQSIRKLFPQPLSYRNVPSLLSLFASGVPLWKVDEIESLLTEFLAKYPTIEDLAKVKDRNIQMLILSADLSASGKVVHQKGEPLLHCGSHHPRTETKGLDAAPGQYLQHLLDERQLTQKVLAFIVGIDESSLAKIIAGKRHLETRNDKETKRPYRAYMPRAGRLRHSPERRGGSETR